MPPDFPRLFTDGALDALVAVNPAGQILYWNREQGNIACILKGVKDVTLLKAQRDAKLTDAGFGNLLESTPDAIVLVNNTGRIVLISGISRGEG